jgi:hypothetical protein
MSSALNTAIYRRLAGIESMAAKWTAYQASLAALLGPDGKTSSPVRPQVFAGNLNDQVLAKGADAVLLPVVTFRVSANGSIKNMPPDGLAIDYPIYDFEFWSFGRQANVITDIEDAVNHLLDSRYGVPPLPVGSGESVWCDPFVTMAALYDDRRNGWVGLSRFKIVEARV